MIEEAFIPKGLLSHSGALVSTGAHLFKMLTVYQQ